MPPEYCEYGPDFETHCLPWLKKANPALLAKLHGSARSSSKANDGGNEGEGGGEGGDNTAAVSRPTAPWTTKERLIAFYTLYQPDKLSGIDGILEKYSGKEDKLFNALVKKYGPEPDDPFFAGSDSEEDSDVEGATDQLDGLDLNNNKDKKKKRRGAAAKKVNKVDTRIIVQKISRNRKKAVTHVVGLDTAPGIKLKEASKAFSKRFAGSSSVKDKEIIIQGECFVMMMCVWFVVGWVVWVFDLFVCWCG